MHNVNPELLGRAVRVLVVGCGGTGSAIAGGLPYLHQAMLEAGHPGGLQVTVMDGDIIAPTNCVRQPFCTSVLGLAKSVVLVSRLNLFWGLHWTAVPDHLTSRTDTSTFDVVIGCVDTRTARQLIQWKLERSDSRVAYWLDLGNSADTGQFVLGQPVNGRNRRSLQRLLTAGELFPEIVDPDLDQADTSPTCSALEALERQEPFVNQTLAHHALALLARLFRYGCISHHGGFVSIRENRVQPLMIDPGVWRRLRARGRRTPANPVPANAEGRRCRSPVGHRLSTRPAGTPH